MTFAALVVPLELGVLLVLDPHAARAKAATEATATIFIDERKALSLCEMHQTSLMHQNGATFRDSTREQPPFLRRLTALSGSLSATGRDGRCGQQKGPLEHGPLVDDDVALVQVVSGTARRAGPQPRHGSRHLLHVPGEVLPAQ